MPLFILFLSGTETYILVLPFQRFLDLAERIMRAVLPVHLFSNLSAQPEPFCSMITAGLKLSYKTLK